MKREINLIAYAKYTGMNTRRDNTMKIPGRRFLFFRVIVQCTLGDKMVVTI